MDLVGTAENGRTVSENRLIEILDRGIPTPPVRVPLTRPFTSYFTATVRAGAEPEPGRCAVSPHVAVSQQRIAASPRLAASNTLPARPKARGSQP